MLRGTRFQQRIDLNPAAGRECQVKALRLVTQMFAEILADLDETPIIQCSMPNTQ